MDTAVCVVIVSRVVLTNDNRYRSLCLHYTFNDVWVELPHPFTSVKGAIRYGTDLFNSQKDKFVDNWIQSAIS